jgi:hypothetical protein
VIQRLLGWGSCKPNHDLHFCSHDPFLIAKIIIIIIIKPWKCLYFLLAMAAVDQAPQPKELETEMCSTQF